MDTLFTLQAVDLIFVAVVVGLVQVVKTMGLPVRFAPLTSIVLGMGIEALVGGTVAHTVIVGAIVGLSAAGLYSGTKTTVTPSPEITS
jgi:hypothetical protein